MGERHEVMDAESMALADKILASKAAHPEADMACLLCGAAYVKARGHFCGEQPDAPAGDAPETPNPPAISSTLGVGDALAMARENVIKALRWCDCCAEGAATQIADTLIAVARAEGAAEEREACAQLCDASIDESLPPKERPWGMLTAAALALRIRARSPSSGTEAR